MLIALALNPLHLLFVLVVVCVLVWAARAIMAATGVGEPISTIVWVVIVLLALVWLYQELGGGGLNL